MLAEHFCGEADCLVGSKRTIGEYVKGQLVKISDLAYTGVLNGYVYSLNGSVNGIDGDHADGKIVVLILVCAYVAAALGDGKFNVKLGVLTAQGSDGKVGIEDLNVGIHLDVRCLHNALSLKLNISSLCFIGLTVILDRKTL